MKKLLIASVLIGALAGPANASYRIWCYSTALGDTPIPPAFATLAVCLRMNETSDAIMRGACARGVPDSCSSGLLVCRCLWELP